ncbi:MAG: MarR family transcriptional regulator, partial [Actinobacteria bacterium]|nr:MarR family transcriptional regulator [Actinomycetota bacterium]
ESALAGLDLRPRHLVALTVLREQGGSTQQALAGTLRIDRTNLVGLLNDLESRGLVARRRSEEDRRRHLVALTPDGERLLDEAEDALGAAEDEVLRALDAEDRAMLATLLQRATREDPEDCAAAAADHSAGACAAALGHDAAACAAAAADDDDGPAPGP